MRLPEHHIDEVHSFAPRVIKLLQWLDRAGGNWPTERAEVKDHRLAARFAQAKLPPPTRGSSKSGAISPRLNAAFLNRGLRVMQQDLRAEVSEIVVLRLFALVQSGEALCDINVLHGDLSPCKIMAVSS